MKFAVRCARTGAAAVVVASSAVVLPAVAKADSTAPAQCPAARVTGVSAVLDTFATGSAAGSSVLFGVALVPLSQPLPAPLDTLQAQVANQSAAGVQQLRSDAPQQLDQLRTMVAPLASGNEFANTGVDAFSTGLDSVATAGGPAIAPADSTLKETATVVRGARESAPEGC